MKTDTIHNLQNLVVIIPTLNAANQLAPLLKETQGLKVLVVDGGSEDSTQSIANAHATKWLLSEKGRGYQIANGIDRATQIWGSRTWLLILHADTRLDETAWEMVRSQINSDSLKTGYFKLAYRSNSKFSKLNAGLANLRSKLLGLPYGDQGLLIHHSVLNECGGYPRVTLMEDVEMSQKIGRANFICLGDGLTTDASKYERAGWLRRSFLHLGCLSLHLSGASKERVSRHYRRFS